MAVRGGVSSFYVSPCVYRFGDRGGKCEGRHKRVYLFRSHGPHGAGVCERVSKRYVPRGRAVRRCGFRFAGDEPHQCAGDGGEPARIVFIAEKCAGKPRRPDGRAVLKRRAARHPRPAGAACPLKPGGLKAVPHAGLCGRDAGCIADCIGFVSAARYGANSAGRAAQAGWARAGHHRARAQGKAAVRKKAAVRGARLRRC